MSHPKVVIPALVAVLMGVPMLMQTSFSTMHISADLNDTPYVARPSGQEGIDPNGLMKTPESDYSYELSHYVRRSLHLGSCSDTWRSISEAGYQYCKRVLKEMGGSPRQETITKILKRTGARRLHSAAPETGTANDRFENQPSGRPANADEAPRFRFRRTGDMTLPQDK